MSEIGLVELGPDDCDCGGSGTLLDHGPECYAAQECVGDCPVPVPCPRCNTPTSTASDDLPF